MSRGLSFTKTREPNVYIARSKGAEARVIAYIVNRRAVIGFDECNPNPVIETKIVSKNDFVLARLIASAAH